VIASVLALAGCTSSPAMGRHVQRYGDARYCGRRRQRSHHVYSINSDGPDFRSILTGAAGDYGPAVTVYPDGGVDPQHTSEPIYLSTCSDFISAEAAATIVAGSYRGISGTFRLTITLNEVEAGSCEPASPASFSVAVHRASRSRQRLPPRSLGGAAHT